MAKPVAIVTGGIGGLGTAICQSLAEQGYRIIAADLDDKPERIEAWRTTLNGSSALCSFMPVNVADFASCQLLVDQIQDEHGRVDVLVNAAGITRDVTLKKMEPAQWQDVLRVNLDGTFHMCRQVIPGMTENGFGRIINISSVNGQTGQFGQTNYAAAKAGMHGMTMSLAREVATKGVTVNSISPGYCETRLVMTIPEKVREQILAGIPVGRLGKPSEIARVVSFLADEDAGFITGANIPVNGGYYMS